MSIPPHCSSPASRAGQGPHTEASEGPHTEAGEGPHTEAGEGPDSPKTPHDCPCCTGVYGPFKNDDSWESSRKRRAALPSPSGRKHPLQPSGHLFDKSDLELSTATTNLDDPLQQGGTFFCPPPSSPSLAILPSDTQWLQGPLSRPTRTAPNTALRTLLVAYAAPNAPPVSHQI